MFPQGAPRVRITAAKDFCCDDLPYQPGVAILVLHPHSYSVVQVALLFNAAALALLGPGAYSVDARLFGLRVTVIRPRKDPNRV